MLTNEMLRAGGCGAQMRMMQTDLHGIELVLCIGPLGPVLRFCSCPNLFPSIPDLHSELSLCVTPLHLPTSCVHLPHSNHLRLSSLGVGCEQPSLPLLCPLRLGLFPVVCL